MEVVCCFVEMVSTLGLWCEYMCECINVCDVNAWFCGVSVCVNVVAVLRGRFPYEVCL